MAKLVSCQVCDARVDADGPAVLETRFGFACRSCLTKVDRSDLESLDLEGPKVPALAVLPNAASREMMRALADRLSMTLRVQASVADAAICDLIAGLYAGRFEVFIDAHERFRKAYEEARRILASVKKTDEAMTELDPAYGAAYAEVQDKLLSDDVGRKARGLDTIGLAVEYLSHRVQCKQAKCPEVAAYLAEFKRRGMSPPSLEGSL